MTSFTQPCVFPALGHLTTSNAALLQSILTAPWQPVLLRTSTRRREPYLDGLLTPNWLASARPLLYDPPPHVNSLGSRWDLVYSNRPEPGYPSRPNANVSGSSVTASSANGTIDLIGRISGSSITASAGTGSVIDNTPGVIAGSPLAYGVPGNGSLAPHAGRYAWLLLVTTMRR